MPGKGPSPKTTSARVWVLDLLRLSVTRNWCFVKAPPYGIWGTSPYALTQSLAVSYVPGKISRPNCPSFSSKTTGRVLVLNKCSSAKAQWLEVEAQESKVSVIHITFMA